MCEKKREVAFKVELESKHIDTKGCVLRLEAEGPWLELPLEAVESALIAMAGKLETLQAIFQMTDEKNIATKNRKEYIAAVLQYIFKCKA